MERAVLTMSATDDEAACWFLFLMRKKEEKSRVEREREEREREREKEEVWTVVEVLNKEKSRRGAK